MRILLCIFRLRSLKILLLRLRILSMQYSNIHRQHYEMLWEMQTWMFFLQKEKKAVIISAEGELKASENLRKAADNLSPVAVHLRTLQTIKDIAAEPSQKIILFLPSDLGEIAKHIVKK